MRAVINCTNYLQAFSQDQPLEGMWELFLTWLFRQIHIEEF